MDASTVALLAIALTFLLAAQRLRSTLPRLSVRLMRPAAIASGIFFGLAAALVLAVLLNPWVGMQAGTFFNEMILAMCLGFLGLIVGALGGLIHAGMILTASSRTTDAGAAPPTEARAPSTVAVSLESPRRQSPGPSFSSVLAEAEHPRKPINQENSGGEG